MFHNLKHNRTVKRAAIGTGVVLAVMAGTTAAGNALHPAAASSPYLPLGTYGPDTCPGPADIFRLPGLPGLHVDIACGDGKFAAFIVVNDRLVPYSKGRLVPLAKGQRVDTPVASSVVVAAMSGPGYRPAGVTPAQWKAFKTANFMRLGDPIADRFAGRLWAASTLSAAEKKASVGTLGDDVADQKEFDYRAVVGEVERATGYAWRIAPMMWRDNQRVVAEAVVAELRKSFSLEALSYGGVGLEPASVDGTYGNVVARAYAPGGVMFGAGRASLSIDANARAGAVR